ncbi:uncharacterized protein LOC143039757 [Oratosquilla oratoria]|uniref:uncharacterized protein LOC143039757 n=1 Tax=Oratosquilla oratoria TaxID=337810 RepID=UPI003F75933A
MGGILSIRIIDSLSDLGLYKEESSGLIRSRGRLDYASIDHDTEFPILTPTKNHLAYLFITHAHERCLHGGTQETMLHVRMYYWMPKCRQTIKAMLGRCVTYKRVEGRKFEYPGPPPLPVDRVTVERPFLHIGIDYSGPITLTRTEDGAPHKYYICLFICTATRLVYLELASDMSALTFLNLFRRFCAMYSFPRTVISDNGSNFVAEAKFFKEMLDHTNVSEYMTENSIKWKFIAPRAPWMRGFYERMISLTKSCLKRVLYKKRVTREELETILREVQTRSNNRPLTYLNEEEPVESLTPNHLLYGRTINPYPPLVT